MSGAATFGLQDVFYAPLVVFYHKVRKGGGNPLTCFDGLLRKDGSALVEIDGVEADTTVML